jgi:uncharacterized membrane protein
MGRFKKEIIKLLDAGVIDSSTAARIEQYYQEPSDQKSGRLFLIFGILGAVLVGLGAILIIAHNWDYFSTFTKTVIAFLPLVAGQVACLYALLKKSSSSPWKEAASVILFFAVGASISLISQVYHIPGNLSGYLLTWMLLVLPLIYLMNSSMTSLMYLIGITVYGFNFYWDNDIAHSYWFWILFFGAFPFYLKLITSKGSSNFTHFHHWFIALSLTVSLGLIADQQEEFLFLAYLLMFGVMQYAGYEIYNRFNNQEFNGLRIIGSLGTIVVLVMLSFRALWIEFLTEDFEFLSIEFLVCLLLAMALGILYLQGRTTRKEPITAIGIWIYLASAIIFIVGLWLPHAYIFINLVLLLIAIDKIRMGVNAGNLVMLNFGMLILSVLIIARFFDTDISFVIRGILFVLLGGGFFLANYFLLKKRKHA